MPELPRYLGRMPLTIGAMVVCLSRPGRVTVDEVRPDGPSGGFDIQGFAFRRNPSMVGNEQLGEIRGSLREAGFDDNRVVRSVCGTEPGSGSEMAVQLARTKSEDATSRAFLLDWHSAHGHGTLRVPIAVVLCAAPSADIARCEATRLLSGG